MIYDIEPIFRQTILVSQTNKMHTYKHTLIIRFLTNELDVPKGTFTVRSNRTFCSKQV